MKTGFGTQFESLIRRRFDERDRYFRDRLAEVRRKHNRRKILTSSMTVVAMHAELEREFKKSATECVNTLASAMETRPTAALLVPQMRKILCLCSHTLSERKADLDATFQEASGSIVASLRSSGITAPYRSLSDSFVQLQCENAYVELRTKQREVFWLTANRLLKLLKLIGVLIGAVVVVGG